MTLLPTSPQCKHSSMPLAEASQLRAHVHYKKSCLQKIFDFRVPAHSSPTLLQPLPSEPCRRHWCPKASHPQLVPLPACCQLLPSHQRTQHFVSLLAAGGMEVTLHVVQQKHPSDTLSGPLGRGMKATRQVPAACKELRSHPQGDCRVAPAPKLCLSACTLTEQPPGTSPGPP